MSPTLSLSSQLFRHRHDFHHNKTFYSFIAAPTSLPKKREFHECLFKLFIHLKGQSSHSADKKTQRSHVSPKKRGSYVFILGYQQNKCTNSDFLDLLLYTVRRKSERVKSRQFRLYQRGSIGMTKKLLYL